ncbi:hypothetical protein F5X96DRAFT_658892 [Biscogniauxia mediterranea]|nr:hypothetical protein F5X96DRAFT_658892 [Biscogniauxia mediterranea]
MDGWIAWRAAASPLLISRTCTGKGGRKQCLDVGVGVGGFFCQCYLCLLCCIDIQSFLHYCFSSWRGKAGKWVLFVFGLYIGGRYVII